VLGENVSTKRMTFRKTKLRRSINKNSNSHTIDSLGAGKQNISEAPPASERQHSQNKGYSRKGSFFQKRPSLQLPSLLFIAPSNCVGINGKDKRLQQLFLRIAKVANPNEFVYNVNMPRRFLTDFLVKEYSR